MMDEPQPNFDIIKKYYPHFMYNTSKVCYGVTFISVGSIDERRRRVSLFDSLYFIRRAIVCIMKSLVKLNSRN